MGHLEKMARLITQTTAGWMGPRASLILRTKRVHNPSMNGTEPKIQIFKPFGDAFELMKKVLFQPFDIRKWLVIGFAAWLANVGAGGGGNFNYGYNRGEEV